MENKSKISIIIPAYNVEYFINKAIESLIHQTFKNIEIIVVNDGSTDNTEEILKKFKQIKVINQLNKGSSQARKVGYEASSGEYIMFLDSDDFIDLNYLEKMYKQIIFSDADICVSDIIYLEENNKNLIFENIEEKEEATDVVKKLLLGKLSFSMSNKLYKKKCIESSFFDSDLRYGEDTYTLLNILNNSRVITKLKDESYYYYVKNTNSLMNSKVVPIESYRFGYKKLKKSLLEGKYDGYIYNFKYSYLYSHIKHKRFYSKFIKKHPSYLKVYKEFIEDIRKGKITEDITDIAQEKKIIKALKINIFYAEVLRRFFKLKKNIRRKLVEDFKQRDKG